MTSACQFFHLNALNTASGSDTNTVSNTAAGPDGCRLPCSQFCSVLTLTPTSFAKTRWERPIASRMASTRGAQKTRAPLDRRTPFLAAIGSILPSVRQGRIDFELREDQEPSLYPRSSRLVAGEHSSLAYGLFPGPPPMPTNYITLTRQELYDMVWSEPMRSEEHRLNSSHL